MADKSNKFITPELHGMVIRSTIEAGSILGISMPKLDSRFLLINQEDLSSQGMLEVFGDQLPILASSEIDFLGQPIMALFGPDSESVEVKAQEIEIDYQLSEKNRTKAPKRKHSPIVYRWGDCDTIFSQNAHSLKRIYVDRKVQTAEDSIMQITCWIDSKTLYVEVPTQWPFHVRDAVSEVTGRTKKSVVVIPQEHFSPKDEKLILPSLMASICAFAAVKTGKVVQMASRYPSFRSGITITRETYFAQKDAPPIGERVEAAVDQGAYPLFTAELCKHLITGLIPHYPLEAFSATITIIESHSPPANFFGDIGYSSAVFSTEAHASALARYCNMNPANWRMRTYAEVPERKTEIQTLPITKLKDSISSVCADSDFARHHAVYELQRRTKHPVSAFLNYTRGVGIACGAGISGFSASSPLNGLGKISITLDSNNRVLVYTSFYPSKKSMRLWKALISQYLSVDKETIHIVSGDTSQLTDSGPEVLSIEVERMAMMISHCCQAITAKRFQEPLPITESVTTRTVIASQESQFVSQNWGCVVVELEVNTVTLLTKVRRVWGRFTFSYVYDLEYLKAKFKHVIIMSLNDSGFLPQHQLTDLPTIEIQIDSQKLQAMPTSATSALRGMVYAACASALSQALSSEKAILPVTSEDIVRIMDARRGE